MKKCLLLAMLCCTIAIQSCNDDDEAPKFDVGSATINDDNYTGGGTLKLLYSTDGGTTYSETAPRFEKDKTVMVKVNNGTADITSDDFTFDWSGSSLAPSDAADDVASFVTSNEDLIVDVTVSDIMTLITSHRTTGKFYSVNPTNGDTTFLFKPTYNGATLNDVRAFVYHPTMNKYYASVNSYVNQDGVQAGYLYTIDPSTKVATRINENDGNGGQYAIWDAIVNWAVAADDSLIALGDFNGDGNGIVKFGTNGGRGLRTIEADVCCGLGMIYERSSSTFTVASGWNTYYNEVEIMNISGADGKQNGSDMVYNFSGFTDSFASEYLYIKAMAQDKEGNIYGLLYPTSLKKTYFVKIDLAAKKISYIRTLGANGSNQFNNLTLVAKHLL
jgi:hypothetical protein